VLNSIELAGRTGETRYLGEAEAALRAFGPLAEQLPDAVRMMTLAARRYARSRSAAGGALRQPEPNAAGAPAGQPMPGAVGVAAAEAPPGLPPTPGRDLKAKARDLVAARLRLAPSVDVAASDGWRPFALTLGVRAGWHINANPASNEFLIPTSLAGEDAELRAVAYPPGERLKLAFAEEEIAVFTGEVVLEGELRRSGASSQLLLRYQACDDTRCLPPVTVRLPIEESAPPE
jgi:hypothetical protein